MAIHIKPKSRTNQYEYAILFLYHKKHDPVTWKHYALTLHHNPGVPVVPICQNGPDELPGTVDVKDFPSKWDTDNIYYYPDTLLYRWFENRTISARKYVLAEYDVLPELPYPEFLADVWDAPVAAHKYFTYEWWPKWNWFEYDEACGNVPHYLWSYRAAICPFGFMLLRHDALETIVANAAPWRMFCEARIATTCRHMGIPVSTMKNTAETVGYRQKDLRRQAVPSVYHPIKDLAATLAPVRGDV